MERKKFPSLRMKATRTPAADVHYWVEKRETFLVLSFFAFDPNRSRRRRRGVQQADLFDSDLAGRFQRDLRSEFIQQAAERNALLSQLTPQRAITHVK